MQSDILSEATALPSSNAIVQFFGSRIQHGAIHAGDCARSKHKRLGRNVSCARSCSSCRAATMSAAPCWRPRPVMHCAGQSYADTSVFPAVPLTSMNTATNGMTQTLGGFDLQGSCRRLQEARANADIKSAAHAYGARPTAWLRRGLLRHALSSVGDCLCLRVRRRIGRSRGSQKRLSSVIRRDDSPERMPKSQRISRRCARHAHRL